MRQIRKKYKFHFFAYKIHILITVPAKAKSTSYAFPRLTYKNYCLLLSLVLITIISFQLINIFHQEPYLAKASPLFDQNSPFVEKETADNSLKLKKIEEIVFKGNSGQKEIALTFDADMTPEMSKQLDLGLYASSYNKELVDILDASNTKATFFLSGMWIERYPDITKEFSRNPLFELANHSYSHPSFDGPCYGLRKISDNEKKEEIQKTQRLLKNIAGIESKLFRFPGGCYSKKDLEILTALGIKAIQWDVEGQDGFNLDTEKIENNVVNKAKNGSIVVLHMNGYPNSPLTAKALPEIISVLKQRGFTFVKVSELLKFEQPERFSVENHLVNKQILSVR